jgi:hypothetical protein
MILCCMFKGQQKYFSWTHGKVLRRCFKKLRKKPVIFNDDIRKNYYLFFAFFDRDRFHFSWVFRDFSENLNIIHVMRFCGFSHHYTIGRRAHDASPDVFSTDKSVRSFRVNAYSVISAVCDNLRRRKTVPQVKVSCVHVRVRVCVCVCVRTCVCLTSGTSQADDHNRSGARFFLQKPSGSSLFLFHIIVTIIIDDNNNTYNTPPVRRITYWRLCNARMCVCVCVCVCACRIHRGRASPLINRHNRAERDLRPFPVVRARPTVRRPPFMVRSIPKER